MQQANSPLEVLTKDDLVEWFLHPATKKVRFKVEEEIQNAKDRLGNGFTLYLDSLNKTSLRTAKEVGYVEGLDFIEPLYLFKFLFKRSVYPFIHRAKYLHTLA